MSASNSEEPRKNIIDMAEARRRQKVLQSEQKRKGKDSGGSGQRPGITVWGIVQFVLFLAAVYLLMDTCGRH